MPPTAGPPIIPRADRAAKLAASIETLPFVALVAPAGYGKTTLLSLALAGMTTPAARYRIELWQAADFVPPLIEEIRRVRPEFGRFTGALAARRPNEATAKAAWSRQLGATFASELDHVREPLVIVIDDAHVLADDPEFGGFLIGAVRALPPHAHLVLCGRSLPALPLAEWFAAGKALLAGVEQLRLTEGEVRTLAGRFGTPVDARVLADLQRTYEGWAAGLALAFSAGNSALSTFEGSLAARSAFLLDANIEALDADLQRFLEDTAVFETLDASLLEREPAFVQARAHLARLEHRGVMLDVVVPGERYRLHPLLREALLARLRLHGPQAIAGAHARAARLLEADGRAREALFHLEAGGDDDALGAFIGVHAYDAFIAGQGERIARIVGRLRTRDIAAPAAFALVDGMIARQRGEPGAEDAFARGIALGKPGEPAWMACKMLVVEDRLARHELVDERTFQELALAGRSGDPFVELNAHVFTGWFRAIEGRFEDARDHARRALAIAGDSVVGRTRAVSLDAYVATVLGDFTGADATLAATLRSLEATDHVVLLANTLVWYARVALLWGDARAARDYAERGGALARELDLSAELAGSEIALAEIYAALGERERCERACSNVARNAANAWYAVDRARGAALAAYFRARASCAAGDYRTAHDVASAALADVTLPSTQRAALAVDALAYETLAAKGGAAAAAAIAAPWDERAALVSEATASDALDAAQLAAAADVLRALATRAGRERTVPLAKNVDRTFSAYLARRATDAVVRVLEPAKPAKAEPAEPRGSQLTPREREILDLVAAGLTNREIAQRFTLSPRTVDTHVERVLAKLGATSRTRAVAIALRLGLVDAHGAPA